MPAATQAPKTTGAGGARKRPPAKSLPPVTVQRLEESLKLVERTYEAQHEGSLGKMQDYLERNREATRRPMTADEAFRQVAVWQQSVQQDVPDPARLAAEVQQSGVYVAKEPESRELLYVGLAAAAPALLDAVREFTVLIEMPTDVFEEACETDTLQARLEDAADEMRQVHLPKARERMLAAFQHWGEEAGFGSGEALRRLWEALNVGLQQAAVMVTHEVSQSKSFTDSLVPTGGPDGTS
jgi:hypothetical protein